MRQNAALCGNWLTPGFCAPFYPKYTDSKKVSCISSCIYSAASELQGEVENLALRLFYMQNAKEDVRSDIAIMKRAAEKAESEVAKAETEKQKQV